jgi:hypothetical protein
MENRQFAVKSEFDPLGREGADSRFFEILPAIMALFAAGLAP